MKWLIYVYALLCVLLAIDITLNVGITFRAAYLGENGYITYVQMPITLISIILVAALYFLTSRANEHAKTERRTDLLEFKNSLAIETARTVATIRAEVSNSANEAADRLRLEMRRSSEDFKIQLGQAIPQKPHGYHAMFKAATKYFFAIKRLEEGIFVREDFVMAANAGDDAIGFALIVDKEDREAFFRFITESNSIIRSARESTDSEGLRVLWENEGAALAKSYLDLETSLENKIRV